MKLQEYIDESHFGTDEWVYFIDKGENLRGIGLVDLADFNFLRLSSNTVYSLGAELGYSQIGLIN